MSNAPHPYTALTPDSVMQAMTDLGLWPDGRLLAFVHVEAGLTTGSPRPLPEGTVTVSRSRVIASSLVPRERSQGRGRPTRPRHH